MILTLCCMGADSRADTVPTEVAALGIESHTVQVNGIQMHYLSKGQGPLLVLLHGFPEYSGMWLRYIQALSDSYQVIAPDLRGYNLSEQPAGVEQYSAAILAEDIAALVRTFGRQPVYLAGHDWGGMLTWFTAAANPGMFRKMMTLNGPHPAIYGRLLSEDQVQKDMAGYVDLLLSPVAEAVLSAFDFALLKADLWQRSKHSFTAAEEAGLVASWGRGLSGQLNYYRAFIPQREAAVSGMAQIKVPVLMLWGDQDASLAPKNLNGLSRYATDVNVMHIPDATHWLPYEQPEAVIAAMRDFFR